MRVVVFASCLLAYVSALSLHIDRQQTNIGPILGHMNTQQFDEHGPSHVIISDPQHEGEFLTVTTDSNDPNRFSASIISAIGSGLAGVMSQWFGQLASGMIPIIGDIGTSVAQAITGGAWAQSAPVEDPVEEDYPLGPPSGVQHPVKPCKPKPTKPHKPFHKPLGYLVHVPQHGNYLVLHQSTQNISQLPEKSSIEQIGNKEQEGSSDENKEMTESSTVQHHTAEEIQQQNSTTDETITNV